LLLLLPVALLFSNKDEEDVIILFTLLLLLLLSDEVSDATLFEFPLYERDFVIDKEGLDIELITNELALLIALLLKLLFWQKLLLKLSPLLELKELPKELKLMLLSLNELLIVLLLKEL